MRVPVPWTNCFGAARSLIALGPLLTLMCTRGSDLFFPLAGDSPGQAHCGGAGRVLLFCLDGGQQHLELKRWVAGTVLAMVVSGWRPRITCIPHAYVAYSYFWCLSAPEGGDQIASILALLLIPVCITDRRIWHWQSTKLEAVSDDRTGHTRVLLQLSRSVAAIAVALVKLQISWLYVQAGISKLSSQDWVSGAAMYYWARNATFGAPSWQHPIVYWLTRQPVLVGAMTWVPIAIEISIGISLLLPYRARIPLLVAGLGFHFLIGLIVGLWSFAIIMWGCLLFLLSPAGLSLANRQKPRTFEAPKKPPNTKGNPSALDLQSAVPHDDQLGSSTRHLGTGKPS